jgi:hypothetical protein
MNKAIAVFSFSLFAASSSYSQIGGGSAYNFLALPIPARVAAAGGNAICIKENDVNLTLQNPSLLDSAMDNSLALNYVNYFTDVNYGYAVYSKHFNKIGTFSGGVQYVNYGRFIEADPNGTVTGQFKAGDYSLNLGYGRNIDSSLSVGATLKTIYSSLSNYNSIGSAVDIASTYCNAKKRYVVALVIKNAGFEWKPYVKGNREPLPFEVQLGASKKLKHAPFRFSVIAQHIEKWDLTYDDPNNPSIVVDPLTKEVKQKSKLKTFGDKLGRHIIMGGEFLLTKNFNLRVGYNYQRRKELQVISTPGMVGFSFGFGFKVSKFQISYGRAAYHLSGASNHFSISTNLSDFYSKK